MLGKIKKFFNVLFAALFALLIISAVISLYKQGTEREKQVEQERKDELNRISERRGQYKKLLQLGYSSYSAKNFDESYRNYSAASEIEPLSGVHKTNFSMLESSKLSKEAASLIKKGDFRSAKERLEKAASLNSSDTSIKQSLAYANRMAEQQNKNESWAEYQKAAVLYRALDEKSLNEAKTLLASSIQKHKHQSAEALLKKVDSELSKISQRKSSQVEVKSFNVTSRSSYAVGEGLVKNLTAGKLENVQAVMMMYDSAGNFISSEDALIEYNPLMPGQTSPYKVMARYNPLMSKAQIEFKILAGPKLDAYASYN